MLKEETQGNAKKKAKRKYMPRSRRKGSGKIQSDLNGGVFENLTPEPPSAVELFIDANWDDFESSNAEMTTKAINKSLKLEYSKLSQEDKEQWLSEESHQLKSWGNLYLFYLSKGGFINCVDPCPKGEKPKKIYL